MKIKLCGLFRDEDMDYANEARPDYIGFVFAESRRRVSAEQAARLRKRLSDGVICAGVFVHAPPPRIASLYREGIIDMAQLHGAGDDASIPALRSLTAGGARGAVPIIRALRMEDAESPRFPAWPERPDYLLLDHGGGGTGLSFDWTVLAGTRGLVFGIPYFLSGGITVDNIRAALEYGPFGVDVSSGAEQNGLKDREKMLRLVRAVREHTSAAGAALQ